MTRPRSDAMQPIHWEQDQALWLHPLPHALLLADSLPAEQTAFEGCAAASPVRAGKGTERPGMPAPSPASGCAEKAAAAQPKLRARLPAGPRRARLPAGLRPARAEFAPNPSRRAITPLQGSLGDGTYCSFDPLARTVALHSVELEADGGGAAS